MSETAKLEDVNKFSKYGFRRRPTYQEIIGLLDENKTLGTPLPRLFLEIQMRVHFLTVLIF